MRRRNLTGANARRRAADPMREFDALPPPLRAWLREATLPWSARSALRIWHRARQEGGLEAALARLSAIEAATIAKGGGGPRQNHDCG